MSTSTEQHTHHVRIRTSHQQLEMDPEARGPAEDYDGKLHAAQLQLEQLQQKREELERKKAEIETLTTRKREFIATQVELTERLSGTVDRIERQITIMRQELEELDDCRRVFLGHITKLGKIDPESWTSDNLATGLERALAVADQADDEYNQAVSHFGKTRSGSLFHGGRSRMMSGEFSRQVSNGMAFNLPIIILGSLALVAYLVK